MAYGRWWTVLGRIRPSPLFTICLALLIGAAIPSIVVAGGSCGGASSPDRSIDARVGGWDVGISASHLCQGGVKYELAAHLMHPGDIVPSGTVDRLNQSGTRELPIFCRRDDYAFLPQNALGGIPCV